MGVKLAGLFEDQVKIIKLEDLIGKRITIDGMNVMYQFLASIRGYDGDYLRDHAGRITSHLSGFMNRTVNLIENDIRPIYVFDGSPNRLKMAEIQRRREQRKENEKKMEEAIDSNNDVDVQKYAKGTSKVNAEMIDETKKLLQLLGVPVVESIEDGESQASYIIQKGDAWGIGSQDYDAFLYGADRIIRNLTISKTHKVAGKEVTVNIEWYKLETVLNNLKITRQQLVDMAILVGVDFYEGIRGIGVKTAYKIITENTSLDTVIAKKDLCEKYDIKLTQETINMIRDIFLRPKITDNYKLSWSKPDTVKIIELLVEQHDFNKERVENVLKRFIKRGNATQTRLDMFAKR